MKSHLHIDEIISILLNTFDETHLPFVSQSQWDIIPRTPFTVLISCLLSLRTKDEITEKVSIRLLKDYYTPNRILELSDQELQKIIYPVGFYKIKTKRIKEIAKTIIETYDGSVPNDFNALLSLKGVGRKTANIVMVYGFNNTEFLPIDTHCHRIPNRLGWINTKTPIQTEEQLRKMIPKKYWADFNHLFVIFGQTICTPVSPHCSICPIRKYCKQKNVIRQR